MRIQLSVHFSFGRLIRFTLPSIGMMIFTSIFGVVDGFFVSNFAGKTPFAAINLIMPFLMILSTVGFMFGTGGTAIVAKAFGEGDKVRANQYFSLFTYVSFTVGVIFAVLGIVFIRPIAKLLGAEGELLKTVCSMPGLSCWRCPSMCCKCCFRAFLLRRRNPIWG